jgi:hypothetical protein
MRPETRSIAALLFVAEGVDEGRIAGREAGVDESSDGGAPPVHAAAAASTVITAAARRIQ